MISGLLVVLVFALIGGALAFSRNASGNASPADRSSTRGEWFLFVAAPVPFLVMFVVPFALRVSPRGKSGGRLTLGSAALSAILLAFGCWLTLRARRDGQRRKLPAMIGATLVACIPFVLTFLLVALELITGGWSY